MKINIILVIVFWIFLDNPGYAQTKDGNQQTGIMTKIQGAVPSETASIDKYYVDKPSRGSRNETGSLHIVYSDGSEIIERIPPRLKSTENNSVYNQTGIADPEVAEDKRTIGWTETFENCCTSYSIPGGLAIYQSGKKVLHFQLGRMVWYWMFLDGGKEVSVVWGATHGPEIGDYQLYEVKTGRLIGEAFGDEATQRLKPDSPDWAKKTEEKMNK